MNKYIPKHVQKQEEINQKELNALLDLLTGVSEPGKVAFNFTTEPMGLGYGEVLVEVEFHRLHKGHVGEIPHIKATLLVWDWNELAAAEANKLHPTPVPGVIVVDAPENEVIENLWDMIVSEVKRMWEES